LRGQILLSESTYQQAKDYIVIGDINHIQVKGKQQPVTLYELLSSSRPRWRHAPRRELRHSHRVEVNFPLHFNLIQGKTLHPEVHTGKILNLSYGGMFLNTQTPLTALSDIRVNLSLSLMGDEHTGIEAKVLRTAPRDHGLDCPVAFTAIDRQAQQVIKDFVDRMVAQR
jgi:adenylate cyclase